MDNKEYIGKVIKKIDGPLGSKHPKHGFIYSVNYGYLEGVISGDGDKLIGVPLDKEYDDRQIDALVEFQERYFKYIIIR